MNWTQVEGKWDQLKGKIRTQWGKLTDDDVEGLKGKRDQLSGALVERYGIMKDQAEGQIDEWLTQLDESNRREAQKNPRV
jgi:uncharacterized protein YjbJ (UPF0337 family)